MAWGLVALGGATLLSGYLSGQASQNAAETQAGAAREASAAQLQMYNQTRDDQQPYRQAGYAALGQLQNADFQRDFTMADFQADPGYQFRLQEGQKAIERSAAARGGLNSGATLKAIANYGQGAASQEFGAAYDRFNNNRTTRFNRLASLAGVGQTANNTIAQAGQNTANQIGQNIQAAGNAQAAGQIGTANAISNTIGTGMNTWMNYQLMNSLNKPAIAASPAGYAGEGYGGFGNVG